MIMVQILNLMGSVKEVLTLCQVNKELYRMLSSENFWQTAVANRFTRHCQWKPTPMTWKQYYLELLWSVTSQHLMIGGRKEWILRGLRHRLADLPAVVYPNNKQEWYRNGLLHRDGDQPAIVHDDGSQEWSSSS